GLVETCVVEDDVGDRAKNVAHIEAAEWAIGSAEEVWIADLAGEQEARGFEPAGGDDIIARADAPMRAAGRDQQIANGAARAVDVDAQDRRAELETNVRVLVDVLAVDCAHVRIGAPTFEMAELEPVHAAFEISERRVGEFRRTAIEKIA